MQKIFMYLIFQWNLIFVKNVAWFSMRIFIHFYDYEIHVVMFMWYELYGSNIKLLPLPLKDMLQECDCGPLLPTWVETVNTYSAMCEVFNSRLLTSSLGLIKNLKTFHMNQRWNLKPQKVEPVILSWYLTFGSLVLLTFGNTSIDHQWFVSH